MGVARCNRCDGCGPLVIDGYCAEETQGTGLVTGGCWAKVNAAEQELIAAAQKLGHTLQVERSLTDGRFPVAPTVKHLLEKLHTASAKLVDAKVSRPATIEEAARKVVRAWLNDEAMREAADMDMVKAIGHLDEHANPNRQGMT